MIGRSTTRWMAAQFVTALLLATTTSAAALPSGVRDAARADFPDADAVVLKQKESWNLDDSGRLIFEEHSFVKLFANRAWSRYADPRIDYIDGEERVELIAARTHLPDGGTIDIPDYGKTVVSPSGIYKWPTFARWRQQIFIFSGVQNDAVLELHYRRISEPGTRRWVHDHIRIGGQDPVIERVVEVTVPTASGPVEHDWYLAKGSGDFEMLGRKAKQTTYRWTFRNVPAEPSEPRAQPWQHHSARLRFTNCPGAETWAEELLGLIEDAAKPTDAIKKFAEEASKEALDDEDKARKIADKLRDTFNFVNDRRGLVGRNVRSAAETFDSGYGSRLESAALLLASLRAAGQEAQPWIAVDRTSFSEKVATDSDLDEIVIAVGTPTGTLWLDPDSGPINPNGDWRERDLLQPIANGLERISPFAKESSAPDMARVQAVLELDEKAQHLTGKVTVELTGVFFNPEEMRDEKQQKSRVEAVVQQVLPALEAEDVAVSHLSDDRVVARASVKSGKVLTEVHTGRVLMLGEHGPALAKAHLPVDTDRRATPIQLPAVMGENVKITVELPEQWRTGVTPNALNQVSGGWGRLSQSVTLNDNVLKIERRTNFDRRLIPPDEFATLRDAVRALEGAAHRTLVLLPKEENAS